MAKGKPDSLGQSLGESQEPSAASMPPSVWKAQDAHRGNSRPVVPHLARDPLSGTHKSSWRAPVLIWLRHGLGKSLPARSREETLPPFLHPGFLPNPASALLHQIHILKSAFTPAMAPREPFPQATRASGTVADVAAAEPSYIWLELLLALSRGQDPGQGPPWSMPGRADPALGFLHADNGGGGSHLPTPLPTSTMEHPSLYLPHPRTKGAEGSGGAGS